MKYFIVLIALFSTIASTPLIASNIPEGSPLRSVESYQDSHIPDIVNKLAYRAKEHPFNIAATTIFVLAVIHMFCAGMFHRLAYHLERRFRRKALADRKTSKLSKSDPLPSSVLAELTYFLSEPEVIFMIWVIPLALTITYFYNGNVALNYINSRSFDEPLFVVIVMALASTRPILNLATTILNAVANFFGGSLKAWWFTILTIGPLLGSLITEPGAITISAILLSRKIYRYNISKQFAYATLGLLFVNISVGGVLTHFAAPPVLMVAHVWSWNTPFMIATFGWKVIIGILLSNGCYIYFFRHEFSKLQECYSSPSYQENAYEEKPVPWWLTVVHVFLLFWTIYTEKYPIVFVGSFLLFLGFYQASLAYQRTLSLKPPILVGCFLAGLMIHGGLQGWWIDVVMDSLGDKALLLSTTVMTAFNDNAAITYLSTFNTKFTDGLKYAVVSGAIAGGGLTIIANAPNPAGLSILKKYFPEGLSPIKLFMGALLPTLIQLACLLFF
ncbi:MAG: putative Na+/H+ antiporter [Chlamydiota bacterium]